MKIKLFDSQQLLTGIEKHHLYRRVQFSSARYSHKVRRIVVDVSRDYAEKVGLYRIGVYAQFKHGWAFSYSCLEDDLNELISATVQRLENELQSKSNWKSWCVEQVRSTLRIGYQLLTYPFGTSRVVRG